MDHLFKRMLDQHNIPTNPDVMNGLACTYLPLAESYIDTVFKSASRSFPAGLKYVGYQRCTQHEEFCEITRPKNNTRSFDLARSDLYLVKYFLEYNGVALPPRYVYLPYVEDAGILYLGGACFHITPVLSDKVISPGFDSVFVRLLRDKITFRRCYHGVIVDGQRETSQVIWSHIYRKTKDANSRVQATTRAFSTVLHYLMARFGFKEAFRKYLGFVPVVGESEITEEHYPSDNWVICESMRLKPRSYISNFYEPTNIKLAIPRDRWNQETRAFVTDFFYIVDNFPNRIRAQFVDNRNLWMILLGHIIFSGHFSEGKLHANIEEHFNSLSEYVDSIVTLKLAEAGYVVNDFYDLLSLVMYNFSNWVVQNNNQSLSVYGKTCEVLYYVLYDITAGIFRANFKLSKAATKKILSAKDITETFNKYLKIGLIYRLTSGKIVAASVNYSGDHKYPKLTSVLSEQESLPGSSRGRRHRKAVSSDDHLHVSMLEEGSLLFLSKSNPTPIVRCNPYVNIDLSTGTVMPNPKFKEVLSKTDELFKGTFIPNQDFDIISSDGETMDMGDL